LDKCKELLAPCRGGRYTAGAFQGRGPLMQISFANLALPKAGALVVLAAEGAAFAGPAAEADKASGGSLTRAKAASRFTGGKGQFLEVMAPNGMAASRILVAGVGKAGKLDPLTLEAVGGNVVSRLARSGESTVSIAVEKLAGARPQPAQMAAHIAYGARLASYRFDHYRTKHKPEQKPSLTGLVVLSKVSGEARRVYAPLEKIAEGVELTRDVVTEPGNIIYPETLARRAKDLEQLGVEVEILGEAEM